MADCVPRKLQLWDGLSAAPAEAGPARAEVASLADQLARQEVFQPRGQLLLEAEPLTAAWFHAIERRRFGRHGRWLPKLLGFHKHGGEAVLGVGGAVGSDWVQYAAHGAEVQVVPPSPAVGQVMRQHFDARGLRARFPTPTATGLPVENKTIDVLVLNFVDTPAPNLAGLADEAYRVLRPGGKMILLCRAWWDIDAWWGWLPWHGRLGPRSIVEQPGQTRFTGRTVANTFPAFTEQRISRRHLRRAEVPQVCRIFPLSLLERLYGRVLIFKAFKPVSAALPVPVAA
jgi:SAM-dependent methyltransferase